MQPSANPDLTERIRGIVQNAASPLTFADISKQLAAGGVKVTGKGKVSLNERDLAAIEGVHPYPASTAKGKMKYWHLSAAEQMLAVVRAKVAALGDEPVPGAAIGLPKSASPEQKRHFEAAIDALVAEGKLFRHDAKFGTRPPLTAAEQMLVTVRAKLANLGDGPHTGKQLGQPDGKSATPEKSQAFEAAIDAFIAEGKLYRHGAKYGKHAPRDHAAEMLAVVRENAKALGASPVTASELGLPPRAKADQKQHFQAAVDVLVAEGKLFRHGEKFGKYAPRVVPWFEKAPHKKEFEKLTTTASKLLKDGGVTLDDVVTALRHAVAGEAPPQVVPVSIVPPVAPPPPVTPPPPPPVIDLRAVLKAAYDELVTFVEFRDGLVELPRLYDEARKLAPDLRPDVFKDELWRMGHERVIDLYVLNEVNTAKRQELAIWRDEQLYYFARWI